MFIILKMPFFIDTIGTIGTIDIKYRLSLILN